VAYLGIYEAARKGVLGDVGALCDPMSAPRKSLRKSMRPCGLGGMGMLSSPKAQELSKKILEVRTKFRDYKTRVGPGGESTTSTFASWILAAPAAAYRSMTDMDVEKASDALRQIYLDMIAARDGRTITVAEFSELRLDWDSTNAEVRGQTARESTASANETVALGKVVGTMEKLGLPVGAARSSREQSGRDQAPDPYAGLDGWKRYALLAGVGVVGFLLLQSYVHGRGMRSS